MTYVPHSAAVLRGSPIAGTTDEIDALAVFADDIADRSTWFADDAGHARNRLDELRSSGVFAIRSKIHEYLIPGAVSLRDSADETKRALHRYAAEVDRIHEQARKHLRDVEDALALIRAQASVISDIAQWIGAPHDYPWDVGPPGVMPEPQFEAIGDFGDRFDLLARKRHLQAAYELQWSNAAVRWQVAISDISAAKNGWAGLIEERKDVETRLLGVMRDTTVGQLIRVSGESAPERRFAVAVGISGELRGSSGKNLTVQREHPLLTGLLGAANGEDTWDSPPQAEIVALNWSALPEEHQRRLISEVPWVIGNLPGLPYDVRDQANRSLVTMYAQHPHLLTPDQLKLLAQIGDILRVEARETERYGHGRPAIQVAALDLTGGVPKAMIGYGNLDAAAHTSVQVPGMNSDAPDALESWDQASRNLYVEQQKVGPKRTNAVAAWLGYDTPDLPTKGDWGVLTTDAAQAGARRLAAELDGMHAARSAGDHEMPAVSVIGHSYGTTVAAIALTRIQHPVDSAVFLGSAGLDTAIVPTLDALLVKEVAPGQRAIYTTHAAADRLAPLGAGLAGRGQPNPNAKGVLGLQNYSPVYAGALEFSSEGDPARDLLGTDGHSLIGAGRNPGVIGMSASEGRGYADRNTESLDSVAKITMNQIDNTLANSFKVTRGFHVEYVVTSDGGLVPLRMAG